MKKIIVSENDIRIDQYLINELNISRSKIQKAIKNNNIKVNNEFIKNSYKVKENDVIEYEIEEEKLDIEPEEMNLDIIYEDNDVIVINKANGIVVHPAIGNKKGTLVNGLINYSNNLSDINGEFRPGIVHRIDAYTTGLIMIAKNNKAHEILSKQLEEKKAYRVYIALVWGVINNDTGTIDAPIGRSTKDRKKMAVVSDGKKAITHFKVLERYKNATLIELKLETGRTHQIRVHMDYINYPIVNDPVYGRKKLIDETGQCLHAKKLGFIHPNSNEYVEFTCDLPDCFNNILKRFKEE